MEKDQTRFIQGLKAGNQQVFKEIFDKYYEPLTKYCYLRMNSSEEAEELVQDIFVKLWQKRDSLTINTSLRAYLYRIALNRIINYQDHLRVRREHETHVKLNSPESQNPGDALQAAEIQFLVQEVISIMPEKRRIVYELSRRDGLKYAEIAEKLNVSVKTVEAHLSKALEQLRQQLKDYLPVLTAISAMITKHFF